MTRETKEVNVLLVFVTMWLGGDKNKCEKISAVGYTIRYILWAYLYTWASVPHRLWSIQDDSEVCDRNWHSRWFWSVWQTLAFKMILKCVTDTGIQDDSEVCDRHWHSRWLWSVWQTLAFKVILKCVTDTGIQGDSEVCDRNWHSRWLWSVWQTLAFKMILKSVTDTGIQDDSEVCDRNWRLWGRTSSFARTMIWSNTRRHLTHSQPTLSPLWPHSFHVQFMWGRSDRGVQTVNKDFYCPQSQTVLSVRRGIPCYKWWL